MTTTSLPLGCSLVLEGVVEGRFGAGLELKEF